MAYALKAAVPSWRTLRGLAELIAGVLLTFHGTLRGQRRHAHDPDRYLDLPDVQHRPDPLLYAQHYLVAQGLAVTWDNPDIEIFETSACADDELGALTDPGDLAPGRRYRVRVRVWNGSYDAPAVGLPVHLSSMKLGAGSLAHPIATDHVSLGVKGSAHCPAFATFDWTTPPKPGQFALQALLGWPDDANPDNDVGQNVVGIGLGEAGTEFRFTVRNPASVPRRVDFEADAYQLPPLPPSSAGPDPSRFGSRLTESEARWHVARRRHRREDFALPADWRLHYDPADPILAPGAEQEIRVHFEPPPNGLPAGATVNINAFAVGARSRTHMGGVTLRLRSSTGRR